MENKQKNAVAKLVLLLLLCLPALAFAQSGNTLQRKTAAEGDTIWVVVNHKNPTSGHSSRSLFTRLSGQAPVS
ncbi:hypothetical protein [Pontibacter burrus]|uniref:Uncharacterized protein n=1 Tax=Pontibacter burrus TaxID=2704466 RepID=A0A6B3LSD7_9BACT|nr:hypothetical protein [Pontibacter burrus]NEM97126.1 hypothetical protein [Pontibacter burrus]